MQRLEELAMVPLTLVDRFRHEVAKMVEDRTIPAHELMDRISQFGEEVYQQGEAKFAEFVEEAESMEQELLKRVEQLREIRERGQVIHTLVKNMFDPASFAPALPPEVSDIVSDMVMRFFKGIEDLRRRGHI